MRPAPFFLGFACLGVLSQEVSARSFECSILARCEGRILSTGCVAIPAEAVRFDWQDTERSAEITLNRGPAERVAVVETRREIVFVHALGDGPFDTMSYAINRSDLTMMVVPDWEKPGYRGEPNWTGQCSEDAQISGIDPGADKENG